MTPILPINRPTRVLLLRHAETAVPDRFHGAESDVGLGDVGHRQARSVARSLAALRPSAVYCSGMRRARETAGPIAEALDLEPIILPTLHERRMGPMSNVLIAHYRLAIDEHIRRWAEGDLDASHDGGESYRAIRDRVVPPFASIAAGHPGRAVVAVLHGVVIRVLLTTLLEGLSPADYHRIAIRNVAVNDLRFDGLRWEAIALDCDASTLAALAADSPDRP